MKKIILSLAVVAALLTSASAMANDVFPNNAVAQSFDHEFSGVKQVKWDQTSEEGLYIAEFKFNNDDLRAYFSPEGEFLGTARVIEKNQLPIMVTKELGKQYPDGKVVSVTELSLVNGLDYYITVVTPKASLMVRATGNGELTVHKRQKL